MTDFLIPPREQLHWIAFDLDNTLARTVRNADGSHSRAIGTPIKDMVEKVRDYKSRGWTTAIYTARPWSDVDIIEQWTKVHDIPIDHIIPGKLLFRWLIDDRAVNAYGPDIDVFDPGMPGD